MLLNRNTFNQYTKEEILDGAETGDLVIQTANFFEKIVILIVQGIAERKGKIKKRVEALEKNESKLLARIEALEAKAGLEPAKETLFASIHDEKENEKDVLESNEATA